MNGNEDHRLQLQLQRCTFSVITSATTRVKTGAELSSAWWLGRVPGRPDTFKHIKKNTIYRQRSGRSTATTSTIRMVFRGWDIEPKWDKFY